MDYVLCSRCGHKLKYREQHLGRTVKCPKCSNIFRLPSPAPEVGLIEPPAPHPAIPVVVDGNKEAPNPNEAARQAAIEHNNLGLSWSTKGEYDKAVEEYSEAIRIDPTLANVYFNRGFVWYKKREYDPAIEDFTHAVRLNASDADYYNFRGLAWDDKGEHDKAIADYNQAIHVDPNKALAYNNRGVAWLAKGSRDNAIADFKHALTLDPALAVAQQNLAQVGAAQGAASNIGNIVLAVAGLLVVAAIVGAIALEGEGRVRSIGVLLIAGGAIAAASGKNDFEKWRNGILFGVPLFLGGLVAVVTGEFPQWFLNFVENIFNRKR